MRGSVKALGVQVLLLALVTSCSFPEPPELGDDGGVTPIDAAVDAMVDAMPDAPPGDATLTTEETGHDFHDVTQGESSAVLSVVIQNEGEVATGAIDVRLAGTNPGDFRIVAIGDADDCDGRTLEPGTTCRAQVQFTPTTNGSKSATLVVSATPGGEVSVPVSGNGLSPGNLEVTTGATLTFGAVEIQSMSAAQSITVRNSGQSATAALTVSLGDSTNYAKVSDTCNGTPLGASATCEIQVRFNPTVVGSLPTSISIHEAPTVGVSASAQGSGSARLQVTRNGTGTIASVPAGISCDTDCTSIVASFTQTPVTLTATPAAGHRFNSWTGACATQASNVCTVPLTAPLTATAATFTQIFGLTVSTTGSGVVTTSPSGITCGGSNTDCSESYDTGTLVELTAEPDAGWEVYSWTGAPCGAGIRVCSVTMNQARTVAIEFRRQYTVTVSPQGTGSGTVTGGAISCGAACSALVFAGTSITLSASAGSAPTNSQNVFAGWGAPCSSANATCTVDVAGNVNLTATFTLQHRLSVTIGGTGTGSVASDPTGLSCPSGTCSHFFDSGSTVVLNPTAGTSSSFDAFAGDCSGATCSIVMSGARAATASFRAWECTPNTDVCDDANAHYVECSADGHIEFEMDCPVSCASGVEKCLDVNPSNGLAAYLDSAPEAPVVAFTGNSTINTNTGVVFIGGTSISVPTALENGIRVFSFKTLSIGGTVKVTGNPPLALIVDGDVTISGTLDISADGYTNGPGIRSSATNCDGSPGATGSTSSPGGGGGGRSSNGGAGGAGTIGAGGAAGASLFDADLVPLQGGCKGATSLIAQNNIAYPAYGGGAGGAVQIVSRTRISITGTGKIDASGGGGHMGIPPTGSMGGGGGGSGGGVLLEAPQVILDGSAVVVSTKGGGGGAVGGSGGLSGADGGTAAGAAAGGTNGTQPKGGNGGTDGLYPTAGFAGTSGGGGGGALGQARFNTTAATVSPQNGAAIRSQYSTGPLPTRTVP